MGLDIIIFWGMENHWYAQQEVMCSMEKYLGAPLEINDVHIVVGVNIIPHVTPAVICMPFKSTLPHEFDVWSLHGRLE